MNYSVLDAYVDGWNQFEEIRLAMSRNAPIVLNPGGSRMRTEAGILQQLTEGLKKPKKEVTVSYVRHEWAIYDGGPLQQTTCIEQKVFVKK